MEQSLERINHLNTHPRDLYLYLFQLVFTGMAFDGVAFIFFIWVYANPTTPPRELWLSLSIVLLAFGIALAMLGVFEANRLSQKRIDATRAKIKKQIDQYKKLLAEPPPESDSLEWPVRTEAPEGMRGHDTEGNAGR
jgi:hypothetical protein